MSEAVARTISSGPHPLDDVVGNALATRHKRFAIGDERAMRYPQAVGPFGAIYGASEESLAALRSLVDAHGPVALVTPDPLVPADGFSVINHRELLQMVWQDRPEQQDDLQYERLAARDIPEMLALIDAAQPGPFGARTIELGSYFGVRRQGRLIAMAGERMQVDGFTEISAVCVDAAFRGQGLAAGLMKLLGSAIRARGETPFLHVLTTNLNAIALYRALGFVDRREMHITVLGRSQS